MTRRILDLSALDWHLGQAPRQPFGDTPTDDRGAVTEWLPARVPGDVHADLIAAGRIPPVETPEGIAAGGWVDDYDWWCRVELPGGYAADERIILEADGIDYFSAVWLDERRLATHAGMFSRQVISLSPWINAAGAHELAIRVWGGGALPRLPNPPWRRAIRRLVARLSPGTEYFPDRMAVPKAQFSFGWDFAPRLLSAGIWDELRLVTVRGAYLADVWARAEPLTEADDPTPARVQVRVEVEAQVEAEVEVEAQIEDEVKVEKGREGQGTDRRETSAVLASVRMSLDACQANSLGLGLNLNLTLDLASARRWWPWDQGPQPRYRVRVRLLGKAGVLDEASVLTGVRSARREPLPGGAPWRFVVNGRPIFLRGANWVPADVLPGRVGPDDYARLLRQAREVGVNFLRVWGGGLREKRAFWESCDRLGIMAWQEFPLACAFLDHYPRSRAYLAALTQEARGTVRALRNHPSLIAWCGGNEIDPRREKLPLQAIAGVLAREDPTRPFIPASPSAGERHDWRIWHGFAPWAWLAETRTPFLSEFGMQALPDAATVAEMFPEGAPASLADARWSARKAQIAKLRHYAGPMITSPPSPPLLRDEGGSSASRSAVAPSQSAIGSQQSAVGRRQTVSSVDELFAAIAATQRAQAVALQIGIEACRMRRPPSPTRPFSHSGVVTQNGGMGGWERGRREEMGTCGGVAFWQFNEPWPAVTWSVIDRAGRPKAAYDMLRLSFQPVLIVARFPWRQYRAGDTFEAEIWVVNDLPRGWQGCRGRAELDGEMVWRVDDLTIEPGTARRLGTWAHRVEQPPQALALQLVCGEAVLAANRYDLSVHLPGPQPLRPRLTRWLADRLMGG